MQNIDYNNPNPVTAFSLEAHNEPGHASLINSVANPVTAFSFESPLLCQPLSPSLSQLGQSEHLEQNYKTDKDMKCLSNEVQIDG
jgi:hypothetical protein